MRVEPPFRAHIGMSITETQIFGAESPLAFDLFFLARDAQRPDRKSTQSFP